MPPGVISPLTYGEAALPGTGKERPRSPFPVPGSEWRLYRRWHENSAMGDLPGLDPVIPKDALYRVLDRLEPHRRDFFRF